eukprot:4150521-Pleurochrysis_carterae.AAC.2
MHDGPDRRYESYVKKCLKDGRKPMQFDPNIVPEYPKKCPDGSIIKYLMGSFFSPSYICAPHPNGITAFMSVSTIDGAAMKYPAAGTLYTRAVRDAAGYVSLQTIFRVPATSLLA